MTTIIERLAADSVASQPGNHQKLQALQVMESLMQTFPQIENGLAANDTWRPASSKRSRRPIARRWLPASTRYPRPSTT